MNKTKNKQNDVIQPVITPAGEDRFGKIKIMGISTITFKISSHDTKNLFSLEVMLTQKGGPAKHVHFNQDEWFYILEGEFIIEVGDERFRVKSGDSLFAPKKIPHGWAFVGGTQGRFLGSVMPAGNLEDFFIEAARNNALPGPDQNLWRPYDMDWAGPPLKFD